MKSVFLSFTQFLDAVSTHAGLSVANFGRIMLRCLTPGIRCLTLGTILSHRVSGYVCHHAKRRRPDTQDGRDDIEVESAALHTDEIGNDIHRGIRAKLRCVALLAVDVSKSGFRGY